LVPFGRERKNWRDGSGWGRSCGERSAAATKAGERRRRKVLQKARRSAASVAGGARRTRETTRGSHGDGVGGAAEEDVYGLGSARSVYGSIHSGGGSGWRWTP
jgi:hypothetical protein